MRMLLVLLLGIYPFNMNMQYEYAHICNTLLLYSTLCTRLVSLSLSLSLSLSRLLSRYIIIMMIVIVIVRTFTFGP